MQKKWQRSAFLNVSSVRHFCQALNMHNIVACGILTIASIMLWHANSCMLTSAFSLHCTHVSPFSINKLMWLMIFSSIFEKGPKIRTAGSPSYDFFTKKSTFHFLFWGERDYLPPLRPQKVGFLRFFPNYFETLLW